MANYLIVVPRGNTELLDLVSVAFRGRTGFNVVIDRRGTDLDEVLSPSKDEASSPSKVAAERSGARMPLGPDDIVVAERAERTDRPVSGSEPSRSLQRIPVRRRRAGRPARGTGDSPQHAQGPGGPGAGAATAC